MSGRFRQSQAGLHTWTGLLMGWLLFLVFVTGTAAFYREGLNRYMHPELSRVEDRMKVVAGAQSFLNRIAPDAKGWFLQVPTADMPGSQIFWQPQPNESEQPQRRRNSDTQAMVGADGQVSSETRATRGGEFFYRVHFDLHYLPVMWARWLVIMASMMILVAIISGVITHKKIFRDFFSLRRGKGQRSWLDGHNATAVLALPFHLMITYTGIITLMAMLIPWAIISNYENQQDFFDTQFPYLESAERSGTPAPLVDLRPIIRDAENHMGGPVGYISISEPNDAAAQITVMRSSASMLNTRPPSLTYNGASGEMIWQSPEMGPASATTGAMIGLHAGRYADDILRFLYFLCGVAGSLMVASGLVMWTVKRRAKLLNPDQPHFGFRLVERLNVAAIGGLPLGMIAMLWANRLLPIGMANRAAWEIHILFLTWAGASLVAVALRPKQGWLLLLRATALLLIFLPLYNMIATDKGLWAALLAGDGIFAGIDAALLIFGAAYFWAAKRVEIYRPKARKLRSSQRALLPQAQPEPAE